MSALIPKRITALSKPFLGLGFIIGSMFSFAVMNGDNLGRVNLFYLLIVFFLVPIAGALYSTISISINSNSNAATLLTLLPFWPSEFHTYVRSLHHRKMSKIWFFYQTQGIALFYSLGGLSIFLLMLIVTDINFVWRSTVITNQDFYTLLIYIAMPWEFYLDAQPSLHLIESTQDSRLESYYENTLVYGAWWKFILLTQLFYGVLLRLTMMIIGYVLLIKTNNKNKTLDNFKQPIPKRQPIPQETSRKIVHCALPKDLGVINWAGFTSINTMIPDDAEMLLTGTIIDAPKHLLNKYVNGKLLVITKSWEPPLGELSDFLTLGSGFVFPMNLLDGQPSSPSPSDLEEWIRFIEEHPNWTLYQPKNWLLS